ncbi:MAG TPA: hypothetical protein VFI37_02770 [Gaiellaceae bacterium]|nr:hypothetical protein [Gaiellaceae bacterium]
MSDREQADDERLDPHARREDPRERAERELGARSEAQRDPDPLEAAREGLRESGETAFDDRDMVDDARR